jgi:tetratricopeptide (TPR) repeat protein
MAIHCPKCTTENPSDSKFCKECATPLPTAAKSRLSRYLSLGLSPKGDLGKAIIEYERLMTLDPESRDRFLIFPRFHYDLAKLYERKEWASKTIEHFERFLELWKDADPVFVELEDARNRLTELRKLP